MEFSLLKNCTPEKFRDFVCEQQGKVLTQSEALALLEVLSLRYWDLEDFQSCCYEGVSNLFKNSEKEVKMALIPRLMENSIICKDMVLLAQDFMCELSCDEQMDLEIRSPNWTFNDECTIISRAEFDYLQRTGKKSWIVTDGKAILFCRPRTEHDGKCTNAMLNVLCMATC